jgi:hypothetical protein
MVFPNWHKKHSLGAAFASPCSLNAIRAGRKEKDVHEDKNPSGRPGKKGFIMLRPRNICTIMLLLIPLNLFSQTTPLRHKAQILNDFVIVRKTPTTNSEVIGYLFKYMIVDTFEKTAKEESIYTNMASWYKIINTSTTGWTYSSYLDFKIKNKKKNPFSPPDDKSWFYSNFGDSGVHMLNTNITINNFNMDQYRILLSVATNYTSQDYTANYHWRPALKLLACSVYKYIQLHPNDNKYQFLKNKFYSPEILGKIADPIIEPYIPKTMYANQQFLKFALEKGYQVLPKVSDQIIDKLEFRSFLDQFFLKKPKMLISAPSRIAKQYLAQDKYIINTYDKGENPFIFVTNNYLLHSINKKYFYNCISNNPNLILSASNLLSNEIIEELFNKNINYYQYFPDKFKIQSKYALRFYNGDPIKFTMLPNIFITNEKYLNDFLNKISKIELYRPTEKTFWFENHYATFPSVLLENNKFANIVMDRVTNIYSLLEYIWKDDYTLASKAIKQNIANFAYLRPPLRKNPIFMNSIPENIKNELFSTNPSTNIFDSIIDECPTFSSYFPNQIVTNYVFFQNFISYLKRKNSSFSREYNDGYSQSFGYYYQIPKFNSGGNERVYGIFPDIYINKTRYLFYAVQKYPKIIEYFYQNFAGYNESSENILLFNTDRLIMIYKNVTNRTLKNNIYNSLDDAFKLKLNK